MEPTAEQIAHLTDLLAAASNDALAKFKLRAAIRPEVAAAGMLEAVETVIWRRYLGSREEKARRFMAGPSLP